MSLAVNTSVMILAGGLGTRLRSKVADRPKVLAEVMGRPYIIYLLEQISLFGFKQVILLTGYLGEQIENTLGDTYKGLTLTYSREDQRLGTGGAVANALPYLQTDYTLIMNGDSFVQVDLGLFVQWFEAEHHQDHVGMIVVEVPDTVAFGRVKLNSENRITDFVEKQDSQGAGFINAGIYLLSQTRISDIPKGRQVSIEREMFPRWVQSGLYGFITEGAFIDIGTPASYEQAAIFLQELSFQEHGE